MGGELVEPPLRPGVAGAEEGTDGLVVGLRSGASESVEDCESGEAIGNRKTVQGCKQTQNSPSEKGVAQGQSREASGGGTPLASDKMDAAQQIQRITGATERPLRHLRSSRPRQKTKRPFCHRSLPHYKRCARTSLPSVQRNARLCEGQRRNATQGDTLFRASQ